MAGTLTTPANPHNNITPNILNDSTYRDPFELLTEVQGRAGLPEEVLDQVYTDCTQLTKDSWLGFLDMFQMNMAFTTDYVQFVEHETPDYVIDDDGAVTRSTNVFTLDWSAVANAKARVAVDDQRLVGHGLCHSGGSSRETCPAGYRGLCGCW